MNCSTEGTPHGTGAKKSGGDGAANFVRHIVSDPKNVPDVTLLSGYLGASSEDGHERLYLSQDLSSYVEIPATAILHRAAASRDQDPNSAVTLWVRKDAALQYKMAPAAQAMANYFAGAIAAGAQGAGVAPQVGPVHTVGACAHTVGACAPSVNCTLRCPTEITPCINTHANTCFCPVTHACPSQNQLCQSQGACTWIGCGHSLACTNGLLCAAAAPAAAPQPQALTVGGPACGVTGPHCQINPSFVDCSIVCPTRIGPCLSHHVTCAAICTHITPCLPTRFQPQCPYPTEICTHATPCQITNFVNCPIATGVACPQVTLACPQRSLGCGGQQGQPGVAQAEQARYYSLANCSMAGCTRPFVCEQTMYTPCQL